MWCKYIKQSWLMDHLKTECQNRPVFKRFWLLNVRYSDPHVEKQFKIGTLVKCRFGARTESNWIISTFRTATSLSSVGDITTPQQSSIQTMISTKFCRVIIIPWFKRPWFKATVGSAHFLVAAATFQNNFATTTVLLVQDNLKSLSKMSDQFSAKW